MAQTHPVNELKTLLTAAYGGLADTIADGYVRRPVTMRINTLRTTLPEVFSVLSEAGIAFRSVDWYDDALILEEGGERISKLPIYEEGKIYLQSLSSMLPPLYLDPQAGESVLDMTAAPGGKTLELFTLSEGRALVTACERDGVRFERMKFNFARQGASRITALHQDALTLSEFFSFDKILLDAPCSGSGTCTDLLARITSDFVKKCAISQGKLLQKAIKLLKKGGTLVYSTCSVFPEENGNVVERVLKTSPAELVPIQPFEGIPTLPTLEGTVTVCPSPLYEGFFVAKLQKK